MYQLSSQASKITFLERFRELQAQALQGTIITGYKFPDRLGANRVIRGKITVKNPFSVDPEVFGVVIYMYWRKGAQVIAASYAKKLFPGPNETLTVDFPDGWETDPPGQPPARMPKADVNYLIAAVALSGPSLLIDQTPELIITLAPWWEWYMLGLPYWAWIGGGVTGAGAGAWWLLGR